MSSHVSAPPTSTRKLLQCAQIVRKAAHKANELFFPVVHFLEDFLPRCDDSFTIQILEEQDMPKDVYAYFDPVSDTMTIREDVYERACDGNPRDRFTIAHEIGHFFLHHRGFVLCREKDDKKIPRYCDPEWQANTFAGFLLMPPELINDLTVNEIAKKCGASVTAAKIAKKKSQTLY